MVGVEVSVGVDVWVGVLVTEGVVEGEAVVVIDGVAVGVAEGVGVLDDVLVGLMGGEVFAAGEEECDTVGGTFALGNLVAVVVGFDKLHERETMAMIVIYTSMLDFVGFCMGNESK